MRAPAHTAAKAATRSPAARAESKGKASRYSMNALRQALERVYDLFGAALGRNRDEWMLRVRRMGSCPCKQPGRPCRPISPQPFGQVPCRAVCGVAALADSTGYRLRTAPCIPSRQGTCAAQKRSCTRSQTRAGAWFQQAAHKKGIPAPLRTHALARLGSFATAATLLIAISAYPLRPRGLKSL